MRRLLWMSLGSLLTLLACAIGWFVSDGWHTNELVLINFLRDGRKVTIYNNDGSEILAPTTDARATAHYDLTPGRGAATIIVEGMPPQLGDYTFPCDGDVHYVIVKRDGGIEAFGVREGGVLVDLRRATRCLMK